MLFPNTSKSELIIFLIFKSLFFHFFQLYTIFHTLNDIYTSQKFPSWLMFEYYLCVRTSPDISMYFMIDWLTNQLINRKVAGVLPSTICNLNN